MKTDIEKQLPSTNKAVIYCRVSDKSQEINGHGLESQETRCRQHAAAKGYEVAAVFPDTITGGGDFMKRPGMVALLSFLDAQPDEKFVVIFDDLKRFARDTRFHLDLRDTFRRRGARIECLNFTFEDTPEGEFIETVLAAQGQLERKQNGRQVAQKMKARMQRGYWVFPAPVGYKYAKTKEHGKLLVRDDPLASIVTEALEGYATGRFEAVAEVQRFLQAQPAFAEKRKGKVHYQGVYDMLTRPLYAGYISYKNWDLNLAQAKHEPLISLQTHERIQARLNGRAKLPARKNIGDDFALRGFVTCADCGTPLRSSWPKGRSKRYPYYLCQTKGCDSYGKSIPRDRLEGEVGDIIKSLGPSRTFFNLLKAMFHDAWNQRLAQAEHTIASARQQIKDIEKQVDALLGRIVEATNASVIRAYEDKIGALERRKAGLQDQLANSAPPKGTFDQMLELAHTTRLRV